MTGIIPLFRRHLVESRWSLGLTATLMFVWGLFNAYRAQETERLMEALDVGSTRQRMGLNFLRFLGGEHMDFSTTALEVCWWNHPIVILTVLGWAVARGSNAVAGEIERGTIDVTLSRPLSRSTYLLSQVVFAVFGLFLLVAGLVLGCLLGNVLYTLKSPPTFLALLRPAAIVFCTGAAIFGYTVPLSSIDVMRSRPSLTSCAITILGLVGMGTGWQFPRFRWVENFSVYQLYAPVTVAIKGTPLAYNASILALVFAVGTGLAFFAFGRRDLPSNS